MQLNPTILFNIAYKKNRFHLFTRTRKQHIMIAIVPLLAIMTAVACSAQKASPYPIWPDGFRTEATVIAFDEDNQPHRHHSVFYYSYTNETTSDRWHGLERHDHYGYCYGWALNEPSCTILITDNVYIVARNLCCLAMPGNFGVPRNWGKSATWLGVEQIHGKNVDHWYAFEHEYWSEVDRSFNGVRYSGPNFKTPRQCTDYDVWEITPQDPQLFDLPKNTDCSKACQ